MRSLGKKKEDFDKPVGSSPQITKLLSAVSKGDLKKVEKALEKLGTEDVDSPDLRTGMSALHIAAERGFEAIIRRLVDANAKLTKLSLGPGTIRRTPLHFAAGAGKDAALVLLLNLGSQYDLPDGFGKIALQVAIDEHKTGCFTVLLRKLLLRDRALPHVKVFVADGGSLLHEAVSAGFHPGIVPIIKSGLAKVDSQNLYGNTAIHLAASKGDLLSVSLLYENSASLEIRNKEGRTPLEQAIYERRFSVVSQLQTYVSQQQQHQISTSKKASSTSSLPQPSTSTTNSTSPTTSVATTQGVDTATTNVKSRIHPHSAGATSKPILGHHKVPSGPLPPTPSQRETVCTTTASARPIKPLEITETTPSGKSLDSFFEDLLQEIQSVEQEEQKQEEQKS